MTPRVLPPPLELPPPIKRTRRPRSAGGSTVLAQGEPMLWLTAGMLAICLMMILGLLFLVIGQGIQTFWPRPIEMIGTKEGTKIVGELDRVEEYQPASEESDSDSKSGGVDQTTQSIEKLTRRRFRTGNYALLGTHFTWVNDNDVETLERPKWAIGIEQREGGRLYGLLTGFKIDGVLKAEDSAEAWKLFEEHHSNVVSVHHQRTALEREVVGPINSSISDARRALREAQHYFGKNSPQARKAQDDLASTEADAQTRLAELRTRIEKLVADAGHFELVLSTSSEPTYSVNLSNIVRAYLPNQLTWSEKFSLYASRWWEFLSADPREANTEGGVFPAIIGTVTMTLIMSIAVVPFGVLAALYLKEYAKAGIMVSIVRIAINNLAGVPSIVFGVFGLGFFVYLLGGSIDRAFFWSYEGPVFGQGGVLWASFTLALLTLPVVIVATEEALSAVPNSMREGSYACGASKWQTIRHIVLPRAMPGVFTGLILAVARGAGEVAPLMLVGVLEHAPELPIDGVFPYVHPDRPFMHLGFSIYHSAFKSQNSDAARPLVFTITLLLIVLIAVLNLIAIWMRSRFRRRFTPSAF